MLTIGLIYLFTAIFSLIFSWFPVVTQLPFGIDGVLTTGMGYVWFMANIIPPIGIMLNGFLFLIGFKIVLKIIAMVPIIRGMLHK
jgi:hypothetical protein